MDTCLNCQKTLVHVEGRRKKTFCSSPCRNAYWRKTAAKEPKYVLWKTFKELEEKYNNLKQAAKIEYRPATEQNLDGEKQDKYVQDEVGQTPQPPKQEPPTQATILSYQELLRLAPSMDTREKREEFLKEVTRNRKLSDAQKRAIHAKFPKPNP
jgi:hypothetical protein